MTSRAREQTALPPGKPAALLGQRVTFTGRFATMSRTEAETLVERAAGRLCASVSSRATMLVVGMRGWPLMDSGHITKKLADAEQLRKTGKKFRIVSEAEFRDTYQDALVELVKSKVAGQTPVIIQEEDLPATFNFAEALTKSLENVGKSDVAKPASASKPAAGAKKPPAKSQPAASKKQKRKQA